MVIEEPIRLLRFLGSFTSNTRTLIAPSPRSPSTGSQEKKPKIKTCHWTQSSDSIQSKHFFPTSFPRATRPHSSAALKHAMSDTWAENSGHFWLSLTLRELATMQEVFESQARSPRLYAHVILRQECREVKTLGNWPQTQLSLDTSLWILTAGLTSPPWIYVGRGVSQDFLC